MRPRVHVLAAGEGSRWAGYTGVPKHLVEVEGERLLDRTVAQFATFADVEIVAPADHRYQHPAARTSYARLDRTRAGADRFLSSRHRWDPDTPNLFVFGDVWYSAAAVSAFQTLATGDTWAWVARFRGSELTGCDHGEGWGFVIPPGDLAAFETVCLDGIARKRAGQLQFLIGWTIWKLWAGGDPAKHERLDHLVEVDDWTEDFDWPADFDTWNENRRRRGAVGEP